MAVVQNSLNNTQSYLGAPGINVTPVQVLGSNLATGDTDLYTVPAGKVALVTGMTWYNPSAGSITWFTELSSGGTYYRVDSNRTTATLSGSAGTGVPLFFALATEKISINCATTAGLNIWYKVFLIDATNTSNLTYGRVLSMSNGNNTIYTVPAGKTAIFLDRAFGYFTGASGVYINDSGSSRNIYSNIVPSGGSVATTNQISATTAVADNTAQQFGIIPFVMNAGDAFSINTNSATTVQSAFAFFYEW